MEAGNTTVDNNTNALYTFTTRKAPQPPWSDDLETGASDWTVVPDTVQGTDLNWSLGVPQNDLQTSAHSGTNAWGSNLRGESFNLFASSFLYSPVIDLSGLSSATLTFWHSFDFSSMFSLGQLGISTSSSTPPASVPTLVNYGGQTAYDWVQANVDLTPFVGKTVQVVWYYQGIDVGLGPPPAGWLIDDVAITGQSGGGMITISKNLGQGKFTLTGPIGQSGTASWTVIPSAPPGLYTVEFTDVAFHQTPEPQSLTLANGGAIAFNGEYSFLDANRNAISDSWERYYFSVATTNRTQFTDSDGDGVSDYGEFLAGTNPTNAASRLILLSITPQTNSLLRLQWAAIPSRLYQVQTSSLQPPPKAPALSGSMNPLNGRFTLHVTAPTNLPYVIQASTNLTTWTSMLTNATGGNLDWLDSAAAQFNRRFYRTLIPPPAATNLQAWTPVSEWLQASGSPMSFIVTNTARGPSFYRVQVRP